MLRAPGNPVREAGQGVAIAADETVPANLGCWSFSAGAVMSEQAVMTTQAMMAVAMRA